MSAPSTASSSAESATATSPPRSRPPPAARGEALGEDVDRDVLALEQRVGGGEHDRGDEQVADQLVDPRRRLVEEIAHHHRVADQEHRREQRDRGERDAEPAPAPRTSRSMRLHRWSGQRRHAERVGPGRRGQIFFSSSMIFGPPSGADFRNASTHRLFHRGAPRRLLLRRLHVHRHALAGEVLQRGGRRLLGHADRVLLGLGRGRLDRLPMGGRQLVPPRRVRVHVEIDREDRPDGAEFLHLVVLAAVRGGNIGEAGVEHARLQRLVDLGARHRRRRRRRRPSARCRSAC